MEDMYCPYCNATVQVDTDDNYTEDELYQAECTACDKKFGYRLSISYNYYEEKVDCWNDVPHKWSPWRELYRGTEEGKDHYKQVYERRYCENCDENEAAWHTMCEWDSGCDKGAPILTGTELTKDGTIKLCEEHFERLPL